MKEYKVIVPPTMDVGSYITTAKSSYTKTMKQNVLRDYNSVREHDGIKPVKRMPKGVKYIKES